ncbi:MAG: PEF-CTERM sorting domain-containing protein [Halobacteriota archaeon]
MGHMALFVILKVTADPNNEPSNIVVIDVTGTSRNSAMVGKIQTDTVTTITHTVPEFTTIAIPVAAIIGLLFLFSRRRKKEE